MGVGRLGGVRRIVRAAVTVTAINILLVLALLVPVELVFGTWVRPMRRSDLRRFSIPMGVRSEFDIAGLYARPAGTVIAYTRDEWGLRGSHGTPQAVELLTIGGSTTEQRYLDDSETWQEVARRELARRGHPLVIANAGIDGQSTVGHAFTLDNWLPLVPGLRPRFMLFYVGANDVMRHEQREAFDGALDSTSWRVRSATYQLFRTVKNTMRAHATNVVHGRKPAQTVFTERGLLDARERSAISSEINRHFLANVEALRRRVTAAGAVPIFMTQTAHGWNSDRSTPPRGRPETITIVGRTVNFADVAALHQALNVALMDYCGRHAVICFDMASDVHFDASDYYDYLHNTPQGAEKIGRYVAERLSATIGGQGHPE
jgi:lysophospholipase L1-like esterase